MLPINTSFRRLLRRFIPQISEEKLRRHDRLIGLRHQLIQEVPYHGLSSKTKGSKTKGTNPKGKIKLKDPKGKAIESVSTDKTKKEAGVRSLTEEAELIFKGYEQVYTALQELWEARRQVALRQGGLQQIPSDLLAVIKLVKAILKYQLVWIKTLHIRWGNRLKAQPAAWIGPVGILLIPLVLLTMPLQLPTDGGSIADSEGSRSVILSPANLAPNILSNAAIIARVGKPYIYQIKTNLPRGTKTAFFSVEGEASFLSVNSQGLVQGIAGSDAIGTHRVTLKVITTEGDTSTQTFNLTVLPGEEHD